MASYNQPNMLTFKSDGVIKNGCAVVIGSDREHVAEATGATSKTVGIAGGDAPAAEFPTEVAMPGGGALARAGGTIAAGDHLTSSANGRLVTAGAGERIIAVADESAVADDFFAVQVVSGSAV